MKPFNHLRLEANTEFSLYLKPEPLSPWSDKAGKKKKIHLLQHIGIWAEVKPGYFYLLQEMIASSQSKSVFQSKSSNFWSQSPTKMSCQPGKIKKVTERGGAVISPLKKSRDGMLK